MSAINNKGPIGGLGGPEKSSAVSAKANAGLDQLRAIGAGHQPSISQHVANEAKSFAQLT
ncbi:MAG: hypothetical protein O3C63_02350 [Cyanobacteria bacterium]|nr:hypothetical protein [Cyanobacteriota bacterium]MDA1020416.1 hypothetical protein [Cyanobacteriota bacterium]